MKTWAKLNQNNKVIDIIKIGDEKKNVKSWLKSRFGGDWVQTFSTFDVENGTDSPRHLRPAEIGGTWDEENKCFLHPKPFSSWILDENFEWQAPKPKPKDDVYWDEENQDWLDLED